MRTSFDFRGAHVLVFGGTTGINFGIAEAFAQAGAAISVASRKPENVAQAVAQLQTHGTGVLGLQADVRDFDAVGQALARAHAEFGAIDVLVSGAAGNFLADANALSPNGFRTVVDIDLNGTFHVMRQAFAFLRKPGASVINITAPQAVIPMRGQIHVAAAKAGVDQITRGLALEWGCYGVRVNAISPGAISATEGVKRLMPEGEQGMRMLEDLVPLQRMGTTRDIANLAMFLGSEQASYISGAIIACDGGGAVESVKPTIEAAARALRQAQSR